MVRPMTQYSERNPGKEAQAGLFTVVRRTRSSDDIVSQIRSAILEDRLKEDDRLPGERELCGQFGVSRATLREGLRTLEALGVIEIRPGSTGGIFVSEPRGDQVGAALEALIRFRRATVDDLAEFRVSFEGQSAHWAALRADADDIARLSDLAKQYGQLVADGEVAWRHLVDVDIAFHLAIAEASKNQVRVAIMLGIHRALAEASNSIAQHVQGPVRKAIARELRAIAEAVGQHDAPLAAKRMRAHVKKFSELERAAQRERS